MKKTVLILIISVVFVAAVAAGLFFALETHESKGKTESESKSDSESVSESIYGGDGYGDNFANDIFDESDDEAVVGQKSLENVIIGDNAKSEGNTDDTQAETDERIYTIYYENSDGWNPSGTRKYGEIFYVMQPLNENFLYYIDEDGNKYYIEEEYVYSLNKDLNLTPIYSESESIS